MCPSCFRGRPKSPRTHSSATAITAGFKQPLLAFFKLLLTTLFLVLGTNSAFATDPSHVTFTLEGCNNDGTLTFPKFGPFICPDKPYTTGNLGKGWDELDRVPHRLTADAGNSAPATQTYTIAVVADNDDGTPSHPGYDVISPLTLKSGACTFSVGDQTTASPGLGGISKSIYRLVKITQARNTICVFDYNERLAVGSHLFPGSSLHSNLALPDSTVPGGITTSGIGARDVSIPVKEISPQELKKDMSAEQAVDFTWSIKKGPAPAAISFANVCANDGLTPKVVPTINVTWTKTAATNGKVSVTTHVYATNPAARDLIIDVKDQIFKGTTQIGFKDSGQVNLPANNTSVLVLEHNEEFDAAVAGNVGDSLNDVATATYLDPVEGVDIKQTTTATASATIVAGNESNQTATITDSELITGAGLTFSAAQTPVFVPGFTNYTPPNQVTGPVNWDSGVQSASGSVGFDKIIYLDKPRIITGTLSDTATLTTSGGIVKNSSPVTVNITSGAKVTLTIVKSVKGFLDLLDTGERVTTTFHITRVGDPSFTTPDQTLTFQKGDGQKQVSIPNLDPGEYSVQELPQTWFYPANCSDGDTTCRINVGLVPIEPNPQVVDLRFDENGGKCAGTATFTNTPPAEQAKAIVQKITDPALLSGDPDYLWTFTLTDPNGLTTSVDAGAGAGPVSFGALQTEGPYTVTETLKAGWDLTYVNGDTTATKCTFTVDFPEDQGRTFSCTFKNTKRGQAKVIKTVSGQPPSGTQVFKFQLRSGASLSQAGTTLETQVADVNNGGIFTFSTLLVPGTHYQLCEVVLPGWKTSLSNFFAVFNPAGDNSVLCTDFTVAAGETKSFAVDNTPPPGGLARTIGFWKNWASCKQSNGNQAHVLDQTLAKSEPTGVTVGNLLTLHGDTSNPDVAPSCKDAVNLLNKSTLLGTKKASDPLFNMAAQLVGAELNYAAGAGQCKAASDAITAANKLLSDKHFNGFTHDTLTPAEASLANSLATTLDLYNNNKLCP